MAHQPTISWRASSDRQIFVSASTERAFASLMVLPASLMVLPTSLMVLPASLMVLGSAGSKRVNRHRWIFILASNRVAVRGWSSHSKDKRSRLDKVQSSWITGAARIRVDMAVLVYPLWRKPLRNFGLCIKLAPRAWNHVLHGDTWFKALGAGLSRSKGWYCRFGVPVVTKTVAKLWILHQTYAEHLESCISWWYIIQSARRSFEPE